MSISNEFHPIARRIAEATIEAFDAHYAELRAYGRRAKALFEAGDWKGVQDAVRERLPAYNDSAKETARTLADDLRAGRLQVVLPDFPLATTAISAVMPQRRLVPPRVRAFVDFLVEHFGDSPPWERAPCWPSPPISTA